MKLANPLNSPRFQSTRNFLLTTLTGALVVGVLGNYLAEFLKSSSGFLLDRTLRVLTFVFHGYVEIIHNDIGKARGDQSIRLTQVLLVMLTFTAFASLLNYMVMKAKRRQASAQKRLAKVKALVGLPE